MEFKTFFVAVFFCIYLFIPSNAKSQEEIQEQCLTIEQATIMVASRGFIPFMSMVDETGSIISIFINTIDQRWVMMRVRPNNNVCSMMFGKHFIKPRGFDI